MQRVGIPDKPGKLEVAEVIDEDKAKSHILGDLQSSSIISSYVPSSASTFRGIHGMGGIRLEWNCRPNALLVLSANGRWEGSYSHLMCDAILNLSLF